MHFLRFWYKWVDTCEPTYIFLLKDKQRAYLFGVKVHFFFHSFRVPQSYLITFIYSLEKYQNITHKLF